MKSGETTNPQHKSLARTTARRRLIVGGIVVLGLTVVALWATGLGRQIFQRATYSGKPPTFSGSSQKLTRTVIVPTLDSPCPPGKNVIWCSSFQLAWNEMKDKVIGTPLQVIGAEEVAARLNEAKQSASDMDRKSFYIAGGWIKDGIVGKVKKDMAAKFPLHVLPDFNDYTDGILSYSYLTANVPFRHPFLEIEQGFSFTDSQGIKTETEAFGVWGAYQGRYKRMREQVQILYCRSGRYPGDVVEYALDLCRHSQPYQVVVAVIEPRNSLGETIDDLGVQIGKYEKSADYKYEEARRLRETDVLEVPEMVWRIDHRFIELIDKPLVNVGMPIVEAMQTIQFRLDRSGAAVESEARLAPKAIPRDFIFNRPFLVYMQKRGAEQPFFVMWVDNDELLRRK